MAQKEKTNLVTSPKEGKHKFLNTKVIGFIIFLLLIIGFPTSFALAYNSRIYPNISIAGVSVGGMTQEEAKKAVTERINVLKSNPLKLKVDDQIFTAKPEDFGVTFSADKALEDAYNIGREKSITDKLGNLLNLFRYKQQIDLDMSVDEIKLDDYINKLSPQLTHESVNASLEIKNGEIVLVPSQSGTSLDKDTLKKEIQKLFASKNLNRTIEVKVLSQEPQIKDNEVNQAKDTASHYLTSAPITVIYMDNSWIADQNEIASWIKFEPAGQILSVNLDLSSFLQKIGKKVEIPVQNREIEQGTGKVLVEGHDGRGIDPNILTNNIRAALSKGEPGTTIPLPIFDIAKKDVISYPHAMPGRYPGKYIDINLREQRVYAFEGTNQVNSFLVSTGTRIHPTPTGEFHVYGKSRSTLMDGEDYYLPNVQWVTWFYGDYSIHGTYWHHNFGHVMSHGCVNASNSDAEWVYNWSEIGTPVYVHY